MDEPRTRVPASSSRAQLTRLAAAAVVVGFGLVALWQAGVIFQSEANAPPGVTVQPPSLAADAPGVGLKEGDLAPDFEFSDFEGQRLSLSGYRGRPVLINFWATWCGPCRVESPDLEALLHDHETDNLAIVAVNFGERFGPAASYIEDIGVVLSAFAYDPDTLIARRYDVPGLPYSYFIDAEGVIRRVITGQMSPNVMESGVAELLEGAFSP